MPQRDKKYFEGAQEKGTSSWLSCSPIKSYGHSLNKREFVDAVSLRYGWPIRDTPKICACGVKNSLDHTLSCLKGGYSHMRHNAVRDVELSFMSEVCKDTKSEPQLLPVGNVELDAGTTTENGAKCDISAVSVWRANERTFFDVRISHPHASSYANRTTKAVLKSAENEKMRKYNDRIIQIEKGSFVPLVFSTNGTMGEQCEKLNKHLAKMISEKKGEKYSTVMNHIRTRIRIALLKSVLVALRGYRGKIKNPNEGVLPVTQIDFGLLEMNEAE